MDTLLSLLKWMVLVFLVIFLRPTIDKLIRAGESPDNPVLAASLSSRTAVQLQGYKTLLMAHYAAEGRLPEDLQAWLRAEFLMPDGKDPALDAWGRPLEPATIDGANGIRSRGPDGRPGTSDDVVLLIGGGQQHP